MSKIRFKDNNIISKHELSPIERQTYTVEEAAKILGICRSVAYRRGVLPTIRIGGRLVVSRQAVARILSAENNRTN
jgi:hypothetical protein